MQKLRLTRVWLTGLNLLVALAGTANAAVIYKTADANDLDLVTSWVTNSGGSVNPVSIGIADTLYFDNTMAAARTNALGTDMTVGAIRLDGTSAYSETISVGNTLTLNGNSDYSATQAPQGIVQNSTSGGNFVLSNDIALGANQSWVASRNMNVAGNVNLNSYNLNFWAAGGTITISGAISGAGALGTVQSSGGTVLLSGANSYSGGTTLNIGTLRVANVDNNLGTGPITVAGSATLATASGGGARTLTNSVVINSGQTLSLDSGYAGLTLNGPISGSGTLLAGNGTTTVGGTSPSFTGAITCNSSGNTLSIPGVLSAGPLTASYGGTISVGGTLNLSGTLTVSVNASEAITGTGTINADSLSDRNSSTVNCSVNSLTVSNYFYTGDNGQTSYFNQTGGKVNLITSSSTAIRIAHWAVVGTYTLSGGTLNANAVFNDGWDGTATFTVSGGTANLTNGLALGASGHGGSPNTFTLTGGQINLGAGGIVQNGAGVKTINLGAGTVGALAAWSSSVPMTLTSVSPGVTFDTTGGNIVLSGALTGSGSLVKAGAGNLTLSGANSFAGNAANNAGEVIFTANGGSCGAMTVANGATNGIQQSTLGNQWSCSSLVFGATGTDNTYADFNCNSWIPGMAAPWQVNGNLTVNGTINVIARGGTMAIGTYPLIKYTGTLTAGTLGALALPAGVTGTLVNNTANKSIDLQVTGNAAITALTWAVGNGNWDTATANWTNSVAGGALTTFANGNQAILDDTASGTSPIAVTLTAAVSPTNVTANLNAKSYTLSNSGGSISGAGLLTKNGTNNLTIASQQTYTGGTVVNEGVLNLSGGGGGSGVIRGPAVVNAGATLRFSTGDSTGYNGGSTSLTPINLVGGTLNINTTANQTLGNATINLTGGTITGVAGANLDFYSGSSTLNTLPSATTATIGGTYLNLRQGNTTFAVAAGTTPSGVDLDITSVVRDTYNNASSTFTKAGTGTMRLLATNTYPEATAINGGTLILGGAGQLGSGNYAKNISNSGTFMFASSAAQTLGGVISGAGIVTNAGPGTLTLTGTNTFTSALGIGTGATVAVGGSGSLGTNNYLAAIVNNGTLQINTSTNQILAGIISGTGGLAKNSTGTLTLSGINTFTGDVNVNGGTLRSTAGSLGNSSALGKNNTITVGSGAVLDIGGTEGTSSVGAVESNTLNINAGTLNFSLSGGNHYDGPYLGTLNLSGATVTSSTGAGPRWGYTHPSGFINAVNSASTWSVPIWLVNGSGKSLTVSNTVALAMSGVIADYPGLGGLPFYKTGAGTLTLSGANTYSGATTVNGGTLLVDGALGSGSAVTVASGATLGGSGTINGTVNASAGALLAPGGVNAIGTLTLANNSASSLTLNGNTLKFDLSTNATPASDLIAITGASGALVLNGANTISLATPFGGAPAGTYTLMTYASRTGAGTLALDHTYPNATLTVGSTSVTLTVTGTGTSGSLLWKGDGTANAWDIATTANWLNGATSTTYADNEAVTFDDTGSASPAIHIAAVVAPGSVAVANNVNNYTFSGSAIAGSGSLAKSGTGNLTLTSSNAFTGGTVISGGVISLQNAYGLGTGAITINSGAELQLQGGFTVPAAALTLNAAGTNNTGALHNLSGNNTYAGPITLGSNARINSDANTLTLNNATVIALGANTLNLGGGGAMSLTGKITGSGASGLTKDGANTATFASYSGSSIGNGGTGTNITINAGTLTFSSAYFNTSPFGYRALSMVINSGGTLRLSTSHAIGGDNIDGGTSWGRVFVNGGTLQVDGDEYVSSGTVNGLGRLVLQGGSVTGSLDLRSVDAGSTISTLASATASTIACGGGLNIRGNFTLDVASNGVAGGDLVISGPLTVGTTGGIIKTNTGTLTLSGTNTYIGSTVVAAGTLNQFGPLTGGGAITVSDGATLNVGVLAGKSTIAKAAGLTLGSTGATTLGIQNFAGSSTVPIYATNLTANGTVTVLVTNNSLNIALGQWPLIKYSGSIGGAGFGAFQLGPLPRGVTATLVNNTGNSSIDLNVTANADVWSGTVSGVWDINSTANWNIGGSSGAYLNGDPVLFDDTAVGTTAVTLGVTVNPASVVFNNSAKNYTLSGSGAIAGSIGLTKNGSGSVTLSNPNTYSGTTVVNAGTLEVQAKSGDVPYTVAQGATLKMGYNTGGGYSPGITINGNGLGDTNSLQILGGKTVQANGGLLIQTAPTTVIAYGTGNAGFQGFDVNGAYFLRNTAAASGSVLETNINIYTGSYGFKVQTDAGANSAAGDLAIKGVISGSGAAQVAGEAVSSGFHKVGAGSLLLTAASTYAAGTSINGGSVILSGGDNRLPVGTTVALGNGSASGQLVLSGNNQTLAGLMVSGTGTTNAVVGGAAGNSTLTLSVATTDTYAGALGGAGLNQNNLALTKAGAGTLTLSGANTYTGNTTISSGTLALSGSGSIASPNMNIATGATFDSSAISGTGYTLPAGTLTLNINKTGASDTQGQIAIGSKALTYAGALTVTATGDALASGDSFTLVVTNGTVGQLNGWFSSVSLPALTAGIAWDTNKLATTGVLDVYNFNITPLTLSTPVSTAATVTALKLSTHASSARATSTYPTGWTAAVTAGPTNGTASIDAGSGDLTYTPNSGYSGADGFTVTFNDGHGWQTMAVSVTVGTGNGQSPNLLVSGVVGSDFVLQFAGIPGDSYTVETNSVVDGSLPWGKLGNYTTPANGVISVTNSMSGAGSLFYRTVYPSY